EGAGGRKRALPGAGTVASYDRATGKPLWTIDGPTEQFVASMVYSKGLFFLTAGFPTYHVMGIKPDGSGNVTKTHVAWHEKNGGAGDVPSPGAPGGNTFLVPPEGPAPRRPPLNGQRPRLGPPPPPPP